MYFHVCASNYINVCLHFANVSFTVCTHFCKPFRPINNAFLWHFYMHSFECTHWLIYFFKWMHFVCNWYHKNNDQSLIISRCVLKYRNSTFSLHSSVKQTNFNPSPRHNHTYAFSVGRMSGPPEILVCQLSSTPAILSKFIEIWRAEASCEVRRNPCLSLAPCYAVS